MGSETVPGTFGFVDLAGFAALTEVHGDHDAVALLERFEAVVDAAAGTAGRRVKSIGDAVMLRFDDPAEAVAAVGQVFGACAAEPSFPLPRAGLHHGPALPRGGDWFGAAVNLAARVAGQASGGQLLTTAAVASAARDAGLIVVELGPTSLRNLVDPVALFEVEVCPELTGNLVDPVCRMQIRRAEASGRLRLHDRDYWFCSLDCAARFGADPDAYAPREAG